MNYTHELAALRQRIDELETVVAALSAGSLADHVLGRAMLSRLLANEPCWESALDDISTAAVSELSTLPLCGEAAEQMREYAHRLLAGCFSNIAAAMTAWTRLGRPSISTDRPH